MDINNIKEKVDGKTTLFIGRIPEKTKTRFKEIAKAEFMDDFGMLLKKMVDVYDGFYPSGNEEVEAKLNFLADEISSIKNKLKESEEEPEEGRKTLSGRRIGGKKNE
jgi:hypothetical protein|tara:strand:+ start:22045 stop:22365 length:321 start_codon:yes stop_codon:yes gene_type:complete